MTLPHLLVAYGLCFGLTHKAGFLTDPVTRIRAVGPIIEGMLACSFCTGFHCGWVVYLLGSVREDSFGGCIDMAFSALASAAFCYVLDAAVRWLESHTSDPTGQ